MQQLVIRLSLDVSEGNYGTSISHSSQTIKLKPTEEIDEHVANDLLTMATDLIAAVRQARIVIQAVEDRREEAKEAENTDE